MQEEKYLIPREGVIVRDPTNFHPLPAEGAWKPFTVYWRRREIDGDVRIAEPPGQTVKPRRAEAVEK